MKESERAVNTKQRAKQLLSITKLHVPWCQAGLHRWRSQVSSLTFEGVGGKRGGLFSVEKAICPSVSGEELEPTGSKLDGYLKKNGRRDEEKRRGKMERIKRRETVWIEGRI